MKKMVMAIIPRDHANRVLMSLVEAGFAATYGDSRGGRLRQSQQSVLLRWIMKMSKLFSQ